MMQGILRRGWGRGITLCRSNGRNLVAGARGDISFCLGGFSPIYDTRRYFAFSFAGPKSLDNIVKKDLLEGKSSAEIADIWFSYHETKENVHGLILKSAEGNSILSRAKDCPFFIQPIFRDDGFFNLVSQFQGPYHFLLAYLADYQMDPKAATPLMTFSIFEDYADEHAISLVRCDVVNKGIADDEALKVLRNLLDSYRNEDEFASQVKVFNKQPDKWDWDDFLAQQNNKWKNPPNVSDY